MIVPAGGNDSASQPMTFSTAVMLTGFEAKHLRTAYNGGSAALPYACICRSHMFPVLPPGRVRCAKRSRNCHRPVLLMASANR